tara:strand:+ start:303 stop:905 length:603 start_codon:yes stop_codon:yes gene_type:complete
MKNIFTILILLFLTVDSSAQTAREYLSPVASPQASVTQNVGMTKISIYFSSPGVKGRKIFGDLVPYNEIWRAGANSPTAIIFSTDVMIGGKKISAGKYAIAMTPRAEGKWTIDFNSAVKYPYAYYVDGKMDMDAYNKDLAHSIDVDPFIWDNNIERLTYRIDANDNKVANVVMIWSNVIVSFQVDTMPDEHLKRFAKTLE